MLWHINGGCIVMFECRTKTFFKYDRLDNLIRFMPPDTMISIISDNLYIHTNVLTLKTDLRFLLRLEMQVFDERPCTFYL